MKKILKISFIIVAIITILEFLLIQGMFSAPIVMGLSCIVGIANVVFSIKEKNYNEAMLYTISTIALNMGYIVLMML